jgi:CheY-like chemotaxis protein
MEEGNNISSGVDNVIEAHGWKSLLVHDGEAGLRLLQMRNWDVVLIDDALPGLSSCMVMEFFREWETNNRVNRQKHVYQVSSSFIPSHLDTSSTILLPSGFNGALGKPVSASILKQLLQRSLAGKNCMSHDIITR